MGNGRISVGGEITPPPVRTDLVHDQGDNESEHDQRCPKDLDRLRHAAPNDIYRLGCTQSAEHYDGIAADGHILTKPSRAEKIDEVVPDRRIIVRVDRSEKDDDVVLGLMRNVNIPKKHDDIVIDVAFSVDAAEEADRIVDGLALGNNDVASKLH